jgi:hypothetical protein
MLTSPAYQITRSAQISVIAADDQVDQYDYSTSRTVTLGDGLRPCSGEILQILLVSYKTGTGAVQTPAGTIIFFDASPAKTAGDTTLTAGQRATVLGQVKVLASDWKADSVSGGAVICNQPVAFHNLQTLYLVWFHEDATSFNDAAGDDEQMILRLWYRRDT